jgi:hypothetical protein
MRKGFAMTRRILLIMLSVPLVASFASAKEIGGVSLPDSLKAGKAELMLNGAGLRKAMVFVKVYAGGLYLEEKNSDPGKIIDADEAMAIKMHFIRDVPNEDLVKAWNEGFAKATGGNIAPIKTEIDTFNGFFSEEAKEGDVYDIIYSPGAGVAVYMKGTLKGTIPGLAFKKAVFSIWLGEDPADSGLKKGMLGK